MGNLVYCPTCGHSISTTAVRCVSCGETDFYEVWYEEPNREWYETCRNCEGKGVTYSVTQKDIISQDRIIRKYGDKMDIKCAICGGSGTARVNNYYDKKEVSKTYKNGWNKIQVRK